MKTIDCLKSCNSYFTLSNFQNPRNVCSNPEVFSQNFQAVQISLNQQIPTYVTKYTDSAMCIKL